MTLTLASLKVTLTSITTKTVTSLPRLPWTSSSGLGLLGAPGHVLQNQVKEGARRGGDGRGFQTLLIDIPAAVLIRLLCLFRQWILSWVRAVFRSIITRYKRLAGFLPPCSAAPECQSKFNRRTSSGESLRRLSPFS